MSSERLMYVQFTSCVYGGFEFSWQHSTSYKKVATVGADLSITVFATIHLGKKSMQTIRFLNPSTFGRLQRLAPIYYITSFRNGILCKSGVFFCIILPVLWQCPQVLCGLFRYTTPVFLTHKVFIYNRNVFACFQEIWFFTLTHKISSGYDLFLT